LAGLNKTVVDILTLGWTLQSERRHLSLRSNWRRPLYGAYSHLKEGLARQHYKIGSVDSRCAAVHLDGISGFVECSLVDRNRYFKIN